MRIAAGFAGNAAQTEAAQGVEGRGLQPAIVEHQGFRRAVLEEQLAIIGPVECAGNGGARHIRIKLEGGKGIARHGALLKLSQKT